MTERQLCERQWDSSGVVNPHAPACWRTWILPDGSPQLLFTRRYDELCDAAFDEDHMYDPDQDEED